MLSAKEAALEAWREKARQHGEGDFQGLDDDFDDWWDKEFGGGGGRSMSPERWIDELAGELFEVQS